METYINKPFPTNGHICDASLIPTCHNVEACSTVSRQRFGKNFPAAADNACNSRGRFANGVFYYNMLSAELNGAVSGEEKIVANTKYCLKSHEAK
jgi:hypothetical protein